MYIMQKVINLSKHSVFMCKSQTDQWDTNGKMNMTLENRKKKKKKKKKKLCPHTYARIELSVF